ncbi:MAG: MoaD/ThiS family protein [Chloroflexota bacterium]
MVMSPAEQDSHICVELALYGSIARYGGGRHMSQASVRLPPGSTLRDLFTHLGLPAEERGYVFRNAVLCDMPGLDVAGQELLEEGDHVGIFSADRAWPYQYRQGARMSPALAEAIETRGDLRHSYRDGGGKQDPPGAA